MISDFTKEQLSNLEIAPDRPLIICDVDDVVVHFLKGFDAILADMDHVLEAKSFALGGNVVHRESRIEMPTQDVSKLVDDFFISHTEHMEAIEGAVPSLLALSKSATVVMLTNLPHHSREKRIRNLLGHGLPFPVITNSGPKGPAIKHLARQTSAPVIFIDDSPNFVESSFEHAPDVKIVHFLHDQRFAVLHKPFPFVSLTAISWTEILPHVTKLLE
jgi:hypothetical protein